MSDFHRDSEGQIIVNWKNQKPKKPQYASATEKAKIIVFDPMTMLTESERNGTKKALPHGWQNFSRNEMKILFNEH